jgi:superfamily I DNA/RNA helicase
MSNSQDEKDSATFLNAIVTNRSPKKLIMAGPGTGKTYTFQMLIDKENRQLGPKAPSSFLVLTFIGALVNDLTKDLRGKARVQTLHAYCRDLLGFNKQGKKGRGSPEYYPGLASLIKEDWACIKTTSPPQFAKRMRTLSISAEERKFYLERAAYYDAFADDDTVFRAIETLKGNPRKRLKHSLVLIDEFQDFNVMEAAFIDLLAEGSPIVIAGDDDQALYGPLRDASWDHIRKRPKLGYKFFQLPFCRRCPAVIVDAVADIINQAKDNGNLKGRLPKEFRCFEASARKGKDSDRIYWVRTPVQNAKKNYFGEYIAEVLKSLETAQPDSIKKAQDKGEPVALVIGRHNYLSEIRSHLKKAGLPTVPPRPRTTARQAAYEILAHDSKSNLGWRIFLSCEREIKKDAPPLVADAYRKNAPLVDMIPRKLVKKALADATPMRREGSVAAAAPSFGIECLSIESSKGRSAPYVFLVGLNSPAKTATKSISDLDICRMIVGLTRTKTSCAILTTERRSTKRGDIEQTPSPIMQWISPPRLEVVERGGSTKGQQ